ncbi:MAG TPA: hypothetical protein VGK89_10805 [Candidatus Eisenbacteria bacterium]
MTIHRGLRVAACVLWLTGSGCTSLRELPRGEYAARPQRDHVRVVTRQGLLYEFDYAKFVADSVVGFKRRDVESRLEEYTIFGLPLDDVARIATRQVDWTRTGMVGGGVLIAVIAAAYHASQQNGGGGGSGGGTVRPPPQ